MGFLALFQILGRNVPCFTVNYNVAVSFLDALYNLRKYSSIFLFLRIFLVNECWILSNAFKPNIADYIK